MSTFERLFRNSPLFEGYKQEDFRLLTGLIRERRYPQGTILFLEGDLGDECFLIKSGTVKIYRFDESKEVILALLRKGDYFGEMAMMQEGLTRSASAEILETSYLYSIHRRDFLAFLEQNPKLCIRLLEATMNRLRKANEQIYDLTLLDLKPRILKTMKRLSLEHGDRTADGSIVVPIKLTHQQLASMVGATRVAVTRIINSLQKEQIIKFDKKLLVILRPDLL
ncbi:Crp/Fnr family transcriptional regulator [Paenibacillus chartarius]|uniref:Crp/Fnr family transcriptional regulator n=1 Tax=Paenibacillus chartarius TaxID=747481 RepID=A0ABV6DVB8_9BACL